MAFNSPVKEVAASSYMTEREGQPIVEEIDESEDRVSQLKPTRIRPEWVFNNKKEVGSEDINTSVPLNPE